MHWTSAVLYVAAAALAGCVELDAPSQARDCDEGRPSMLLVEFTTDVASMAEYWHMEQDGRLLVLNGDPSLDGARVTVPENWKGPRVDALCTAMASFSGSELEHGAPHDTLAVEHAEYVPAANPEALREHLRRGLMLEPESEPPCSDTNPSWIHISVDADSREFWTICATNQAFDDWIDALYDLTDRQPWSWYDQA